MNVLRYIFYAAASVVLSTGSFLFGGITQLALWRSGGRRIFLFINIPVILLFLLLNAPKIYGPFGLVILLVFIFSELERRGQNMRRAAVVSVLAVAGLSGAALLFWLTKESVGLHQALSDYFKSDFIEATRRFPELKVDIEELVMQAPSMYVIGLAATLWTSLIFERRVRLTFGDRVGIKRVTYLSDFRVPVVAIWPALASFVGGFIIKNHAEVHIVSLNVFNIFVFIYFLQGLAVVATLFRVYRVRLLWQALSYIILFVQLVPVSLFGLLDFWFDFRSRVRGKSPEIV